MNKNNTNSSIVKNFPVWKLKDIGRSCNWVLCLKLLFIEAKHVQRISRFVAGQCSQRTELKVKNQSLCTRYN